MSSFLTCQRPDICSTTSLESARTSMRAPGSISTAARSPSISPVYSATVFETTPRSPARSASTAPVVGSRTSAPYAAGPGLPRDPPSVSTTSRRSLIVTRRSQPGVLEADQDPAALLAPDHLLRCGAANCAELLRVDLHPAALAATGVQRCGTQPAGLSAHLLVERHQLRVEPRGRRNSLVRDLRHLGVDEGNLTLALLGRGPLLRRQYVARPGELGERTLVRFEPLHHLELDILEIRTPTGERGELARQRLQILRRLTSGVQAPLVPSLPGPDLLDVRLGLGHLATQVADRCPGRHEGRI